MNGWVKAGIALLLVVAGLFLFLRYQDRRFAERLREMKKEYVVTASTAPDESFTVVIKRNYYTVDFFSTPRYFLYYRVAGKSPEHRLLVTWIGGDGYEGKWHATWVNHSKAVLTLSEYQGSDKTFIVQRTATGVDWRGYSGGYPGGMEMTREWKRRQRRLWAEYSEAGDPVK